MEYFIHPERAKENVSGPFYTVDIGCDCGCCLPEEIAPDLLKTTEDQRVQTYFYKQPETELEIARAIKAINICPIHNVRYGGTEAKIIVKVREGQSDFIISTNGEVILSAFT